MVLVGVTLLTLGTAVLTQVGADTPYPLLLAALAVSAMAAYAAMRPETVPAQAPRARAAVDAFGDHFLVGVLAHPCRDSAAVALARQERRSPGAPAATGRAASRSTADPVSTCRVP